MFGVPRLYESPRKLSLDNFGSLFHSGYISLLISASVCAIH
jgi:hypothetical protein